LRHLDKPAHSRWRNRRSFDRFCATAPLAPVPYRKGRRWRSGATPPRARSQHSPSGGTRTAGAYGLPTMRSPGTGDSPMNERAGKHGSDLDGGRVDLIRSDLACILQKHCARSSARVSQHVLVLAHCVVAQTQTRTGDSRRPMAGLWALNGNTVERFCGGSIIPGASHSSNRRACSSQNPLSRNETHRRHHVSDSQRESIYARVAAASFTLVERKARARRRQAASARETRERGEMYGIEPQKTRRTDGWGPLLAAAAYLDLIHQHSAAVFRKSWSSKFGPDFFLKILGSQKSGALR
jgi:hypothetical protein